jgi:hypothetical protein
MNSFSMDGGVGVILLFVLGLEVFMDHVFDGGEILLGLPGVLGVVVAYPFD